jgi:hypothetical protein
MPDLLIKLYDHHWSVPADEIGAQKHFIVRKPIGPEVTKVVVWVKEHFNSSWVSEVSVALRSYPMGCYIALINKELAGFCCFNSTAMGVISVQSVLLKGTDYKESAEGY